MLLTPPIRRLAAELALLSAAGLVMSVLGPYGSGELPYAWRLAYWLVCIVGGGLIGVAIDQLVAQRMPAFWPRLTIVSLAMSFPVAVLVWATGFAMFDDPGRFERIPGFWFQVLVVCFGLMALRQLAWAHREAEPKSGASDAPPADPLAAFRQRLSAKRRAAALIAVQAEDHYLRVHTDAGDELIAGRFSDALAELTGVAGFQTHRSWWVAAEAIDDVRWLRGRGQARLKCGLTVPISRAQAAPLRAAGWR